MSVRVLLVSVAVASVLRLAQTAAAGSALPPPAAPHDATAVCANRGKVCRHTNRGDQGGPPFALPCHEALVACPRTLPRSLPHSFHVPTPLLDGLQEELRRKLQEANAALEELRGSTRKKASWLSKRTSKMVRNPVHLFIRSANGTHWYQVRRALSVWELKNALLALPASPLEDGDELRVCSCAFDSYDLGLKPARTLDNMEETLGETVAHQANYLESLWSSPGSSQ